MSSAKRPKLDPSPLAVEKRTWPGWCTLESEPAIFNELLQDIGVSETQVEEIYSLDNDSLNALKPAHGFIFLFRWKEESIEEEIETTCPENIWFANQVTDNSCASLALLNIVYNSPDIKLGPELQAFKEYSDGLTPPLKGLAIANFGYLREIHNTFARKSEMMDSDIDLAEFSKRRGKGGAVEEEDSGAFHFIAYVHVDDTLWELDGLKRQPVRLRTCSKNDWISLVGPFIQARIARYPEEELRFTLLALIPAPLTRLRAQLRTNELTIGLVEEQLDEVSPAWKQHYAWAAGQVSRIAHDPLSWKDHLDPATVDRVMAIVDADTLFAELKGLAREQHELKCRVRAEAEKVAAYRLLAEERRMDYEPFVEAMGRIVAEKRLAREILTS